MTKKNLKKSLQDFFANPIFYVVLLGVVLVIAMVILSISKMKSETADQEQVAVKGARNGQQTISVSISDPNNLAALSNTQSTEAEVTATDTPRKILYQSEGPVTVRGKSLFKINLFQKLATQPLKFDFFNDKGNSLTPEYLKTANGQKMHFYLISANLREFLHLSPDYKDSKWNVGADMYNPGSYYAYVVSKTIKDNFVDSVNELVVREKSPANPNYPGLTPNMVAITDGYQLKAVLSPGQSGGINYFNLAVTKDGKPVQLQPIYESFGNMVVLKQGLPDSMIVAQPLAGATDAKGLINFSANIMKIGKYTAFIELKIEGKTRLFPITFEIK